MGREDTKTKDYIRVRIGLSLAWKPSLATNYEDSFLCNRLQVNPRSPRCLYKLEGLVRKGQIHITIVIQARLLGFSHYDLEVDQLL